MPHSSLSSTTTTSSVGLRGRDSRALGALETEVVTFDRSLRAGVGATLTLMTRTDLARRRVNSSAAQPRLRRVLGPLEVTASGVGIIIGAGIYVLLGAATAQAGSAVWSSFALAAGLCALTGLSYAELASMYPNAGAEYDYTRRAFHERWAFLVGWTMIVGLMVAAAAIAVGFAHYLQHFVDLPLAAGAVGLLLVDAVIAMSGIQRSARLTLALSAVQ